MQLIESLLSHGLIKEGTLVYGHTRTAGLGQSMQYVPMELMVMKRKPNSFVCRDRVGRPYVMEFERVERLDGMDLARFAAVYNIKPDGSSKAQGKKRGRKPKSAQINISEGDTNGQDKRTEDHHQAEPACA